MLYRKNLIPYLYIFVLIFLFFAPFNTFAEVSLDNVPATLKKEFLIETGMEWDEAGYSARKNFFENWKERKRRKNQANEIYSIVSKINSTQDDAQPVLEMNSDILKKYGDELMNVSFDIKYMYKKKYGESWLEADKEKRLKFLIMWEETKDKRAQKALAEKQKREEKLLKEQQLKLELEQKRLLKKQIAEQKRLEKEQKKLEEKMKFDQKILEVKQKREEMKARMEEKKRKLR